MRRLNRGPEPSSLPLIRATQLTKLRALGRPPTSKEISGYAVVGKDIWRAQHNKCCYCEAKLHLAYHDVEHYRPKTTADRLPGCASTHGYWWLAFSWENLLFSCAGCNRSAKRIRFPLEIGTTGSIAEDMLHIGEKPLLINPYETNPVDHIIFKEEAYQGTSIKRWYARPRNSSLVGNYTIDVCSLNRGELLELRQDHWENCLLEPISDLASALMSSKSGPAEIIFAHACRLFSSAMIFSALSYDAFTESISNAELFRVLGRNWPQLRS